MDTMKRRTFIRGTVGAAAGVAALSSGRGASAQDKIVVGFMGVGGRGRSLLQSLIKRNDIEIKYICDADSRAYAAAAEIVVEGHDHKPKFVQDFRRMLEDKDVDAIVNATSDRWHALATVLACQAGKDVYVEKPLSLSIWDGRKMVEAARKYNRVVQVGTQTRSAPYAAKAREYIASGKLGDVYLVRVFFIQDAPQIEVAPEGPVPEGMDYDLWCGPSPKLPYRPGRWFQAKWDYYTGFITADMIHQVDMARYIVGLEYPDSVCNAGGVYLFDDGREQPDTQFTTFECGKMTMQFEAALKAPYMHRIVNLPKEQVYPDWPFCATKVEVLGTKAMMCFGRHGGGWQVFEGDVKVRKSNAVVSEPSDLKFGNMAEPHFDDFFNCIRSRATPKADIEEGHRSMLLCHLANISYRVGNRKLRFDRKTETFSGDADANKLLKANYRAPWLMPDPV